MMTEPKRKYVAKKDVLKHLQQQMMEVRREKEGKILAILMLYPDNISSLVQIRKQTQLEYGTLYSSLSDLILIGMLRPLMREERIVYSVTEKGKSYLSKITQKRLN